jgi:heme A synthase
MTGYQKLAVAATSAIYGLVIMGGVVRVTGSGLGCPDWPLCHGQVIPPLEKPVLIEYSHRLAASAGGFLVVGLAVATWLTQRRSTVMVAAAGAAVVLLVFQALLGGITVVNELPPNIVTAHLAIALVLLSLLLLITTLSFLGPQPAEETPTAAPFARCRRPGRLRRRDARVVHGRQGGQPGLHGLPALQRRGDPRRQ